MMKNGLPESVRYLHAIEKDPATMNPALRVLLLQSEVSKIGYRIVRAVRTPDEAAAQMADLQTDLGDAMVQCRMLALDLGLDPDEVLKLGIRHTEERFEDFWGKKNE